MRTAWPGRKKMIKLEIMHDRDRGTIKLAAAILGNVAAIAIGVALFEKRQQAAWIAIMAGIMSYTTIRSLKSSHIC